MSEFVVNKGKTNGPASRFGGGGLERPLALRFSPDGRALYVVDFGVLTVGERGPQPREKNKPLAGFMINYQVRHGLGVMPAFPKERLSDEELDDLVAYLKRLRHHKRG